MNIALKALQLKAKHQVYTLLSGHNLSKLHGEGYDFAELREYQMGDDIRKINWTITAKLGKPYIKELHANRELSIVVSALMDGSLYFGTGNSKQKKLTEVATLLGYLAQQNNDVFTGLAYLQNQSISTPATKQLYHIERFSKALYEAPLLGTKLSYKESIENLFQRIHRPSLLFVLGDFLEEIDLSLLAQKHEVIAIIIREEAEESPQLLREVTLQNPQNLQKKETYFAKKNIQQYLKQLHINAQKTEAHFATYGIRSVKIVGNQDVVSRLMTLFG